MKEAIGAHQYQSRGNLEVTPRTCCEMLRLRRRGSQTRSRVVEASASPAPLLLLPLLPLLLLLSPLLLLLLLVEAPVTAPSAPLTPPPPPLPLPQLPPPLPLAPLLILPRAGAVLGATRSGGPPAKRRDGRCTV